jgi:hypothetical protein
MVYITFRNPIKELYNYPPAIHERVKSLAEYKDQIPKELSEINAEYSAPFVR